MSHTALIKFAPIFTLERFNDPAWSRPGRTMYYNGALRFLPAETSIPLIVDHDDSREIGAVHELFKMDWTDGPWICARATVNTPPSWLKRGSAASFCCKAPDLREINIRGTKAEVIAWAIAREVSVLSPSKRPAEPRAEVVSYRPAEVRSSPAAVPTTSDRAVAGEVIDDDYRPAIFDDLGRKLGYRVTYDNVEAALTEAHRSPLDTIYDEMMAARRLEPQVITRHGIGQVLGVR